MSANLLTPVVLCGGSGTRLWPLSRQSFPKQFVPLINNKSLLQLTLERLANFASPAIIVAAEEHRFMVTDALQTAHLAPASIILEPAIRNTAAATALAAIYASKIDHPKQLLLFCPADHYIPDSSAFINTVKQGLCAAQAGAIVTFGVAPSFPSTAYGYLQQGAKRNDGSYAVLDFIEKPTPSAAETLLLQSDTLWNAGIFLTRADVFIAALEKHAPDILLTCQAALASATEETPVQNYLFIRPNKTIFIACRSQSIDYAVMEHFQDVAVVPFSGKWSDVGSWNAVADLVKPNSDNNRIEGAGIALRSKATYIHAATRLVVTIGTKNLLVVDTPDALLVVDQQHVEYTKEAVEILSLAQRSETVLHRKVARPWGWYDTLDTAEHFQIRRICIKSGNRLALQKHHQRAEHWIVIKGTAEVTRGTEVFLLTENQSTLIPAGEKHSLYNSQDTDLEIIEVRSGNYLHEDDVTYLDS